MQTVELLCSHTISMEKLHSSRPWRKNNIGSAVMASLDFGEVFGGRLRHTGLFSLQLEDYFEIFVSSASSSSIPLLDLPSAGNFEAVGGSVDYSDVFGTFLGGEIAASYEELLPEMKRSGVSSSEGRTKCDVFSEHQEKTDLEQLNGHTDVKLKEFMLHHVMVQEPLNGVISENILKATSDAIPGYSIDVVPIDSVIEGRNKAVNTGNADSSDTQKRTLDGEQMNEATSYIVSNARNPIVNLKSDMAHSKSNRASMLNVSGDEKHLSRSSRYHLTSSGDIPLGDVTYVQVSEINLQTKPLQVPPPSRSPPELSKKEERPKVLLADSRFYVEEGSFLTQRINNQLHSRSEADDIHKISDSRKDISGLHNADVDPSSAAALSIAAVKEAMELAQARINSAKELRDRKRDKCHMKTGLHKALNIGEDGAVPHAESNNCSNNLVGKSNMVSECTFVEREKMSAEEKIALKPDEIKVQLSSYRKNQQVTKDNASKSSKVAFKLCKIPEEWKRDMKYHELIRNDKFLNTEKDIYIHEDEKKRKADIFSCEDKENTTNGLKKAIEVEEVQKSMEVSFFIGKLKEGNDLKGHNMACTVDVNKNLVDASTDPFLLKDSASELEKAYGSHLFDDNQKLNDAREDNTKDNVIGKPSSALDSCLQKESEKTLLNSNFDFEVGVTNEHSEDRRLKVAGVSSYLEFRRKLNFSYLGSELNDSYKEVKVPGETAIFEKEIRVPEELDTYSATDKMEIAEELQSCSKYDIKTRSMKYQYSCDEFGCKVENNDSAAEKVENDGLQTNKVAHIPLENKLQQEVIHDVNGLENFKMHGKVNNAELEQILNSRKGTYYEDCYIKRSSKATPAVQEGQESMETFTNKEVQSSGTLESAEGGYGKRLNESITEIPVPYKFVENQISLNLADKTTQIAENVESDTQKIFLSRKEGSQDAELVSHVEKAQNHKHSSTEEEESRRKMNIVRERDQDQEIRLEEQELDIVKENGKIAAEKANHEAHQQALAEAQKRTERLAVERATAEARQRTLADARERAEKAAYSEKASKEAKLRAERAAVERATEEARRRAIEKALAEKAAAGVRERTAQIGSYNKERMRKDNGTAHFKATNHINEDPEARGRSSSTQIPRNSQSQTATFSRDSDSSNSVGGTESNMRCREGQERQQTAERAENALCERNMRDILVQREQAERDRLAESLDVMVKRWSTGRNGNLPLLLSTLQYILVPESGWQPIPLTELLNVPAVKKAYRKATLCVHPDKLQQRGATIQQKYICEKVFDLLKEAWDRFNSEER